MPLTREAFRAYYCAAAQAVAHMPGDTELRHKRALELVGLAQAEEEKRFQGVELLNEQLAKKVAELEQLAADRGEEVRGRGEDLRVYLRAVERIAEELRGRARHADETARNHRNVVHQVDIDAGAIGTSEGRARAYRNAAELLDKLEDRAEHIVDHAAETLAQLEVTLGTHLVGHPTDDSEAVRWGRVAGRVLALVELEQAQGRHDAAVAAELERVQDGLSEAQRRHPLFTVDATGVRLAGVPVDALEAFLKRFEGKASAEAEPVRGALLGVVQELAALMVRHCAPAGAGLLGGTALVEPAPLNPGETPECGAKRFGVGLEPWCTRPAGHQGEHMSARGALWGGED